MQRIPEVCKYLSLYPNLESSLRYTYLYVYYSVEGILVELEEEIEEANAYNGGGTGGGLTRDQILAGWDDDDDSTESTFDLILNNTLDDVDSVYNRDATFVNGSEVDEYEAEINTLDQDFEEFSESKTYFEYFNNY